MENNKRTFLNNMSVYNNKAAMDQMNQFINYMNSNSLFSENIQQTMNNFEQNKKKYIQTNFNNMTNILSLINLPIIVPYHNKHPLINCKTPGRNTGNNCWRCDNCSTNYSLDVPTFYCTACDFDLCQKCLLSLNAFMIAIYNYSKGNIYLSQQFDNAKYYEPKLHNHPIVRILREPTFTEVYLKCNMCLKDIQKDEEFYFCSLCNYCICVNCYQNGKKDDLINNEYIDANFMFKKK